jgi:small subunit ribosomal protein S18
VVIRESNSGRRGPARGGRGRYTAKKKVCRFCVDKVKEISYKDSLKIGRYITDRGKIEPRRRTGTCARHQRALAEAIKRARHIALLPFVAQHIQSSGGATLGGLMNRRPIRDIRKDTTEEIKKATPVVAEGEKAAETIEIEAKLETIETKTEIVETNEVKAEKEEAATEETEEKKEDK